MNCLQITLFHACDAQALLVAQAVDCQPYKKAMSSNSVKDFREGDLAIYKCLLSAAVARLDYLSSLYCARNGNHSTTQYSAYCHYDVYYARAAAVLSARRRHQASRRHSQTTRRQRWRRWRGSDKRSVLNVFPLKFFFSYRLSSLLAVKHWLMCRPYRHVGRGDIRRWC